MTFGCRQTITYYKPSESKLTLKIFERYLREENVPYRVADDGSYVAERGQTQKMIEIGNRANSETIKTTGIELNHPCAASKLREYLEGHSIVYVEEVEDGKPLLVLTTREYEKNKVIQEYSRFAAMCGEVDCKPSPNPTPGCRKNQ